MALNNIDGAIRDQCPGFVAVTPITIMVLACVAERLKELTDGLRGLPGLPGPARHGRPGRAGKRGIPGTYRSERSNSLKCLGNGLFELMDAFVVRMRKLD